MHASPAIPLALALLSLSPTALAADWVFLGLDRRGNIWHLDRSSIAREEGVATAWKRIEFRPPHPRFRDGSPIERVFLLDVAHCAEGRVGAREIRLLDPHGKLVAAHEHGLAGMDWPAAAPAALIGKIVALLCARAESPPP